MFMRKNDILERIGQVLSQFEIDLGYVIGSFLHSDDFEDVDVAVLTTEDLSPYENFRFSMLLARKLEQEIEPRLEFDVKVLNTSPVNFQYEVIRTGELVFCGDEVRCIRYEERVLAEYLDYAPTSCWLDERFLVEVRQ
jgi:predicted nucleotidyltransferase